MLAMHDIISKLSQQLKIVQDAIERLNITDEEARADGLRSQTLLPDFWDDSEAATKSESATCRAR